MRQLRIVHLVEALGIGGLERVVQSLARHARESGREVEVICAVRGGPVAAQIEKSSVKVTVLGAAGYGPRDILRAARALSIIDPDVVHTHGHFAGVLGRAACWWAGARIAVHHMHTIDTTLRPKHRRVERLLSRVTYRVVCCSRAVATHAREDLGVAESLLVIVPNGIDAISPLSPAAARDRLGNPRRPLIGCLGSLTPHKGQAVLLRALDHLPGDRPLPTIVLIGAGPERGPLESLAAGLRSRPRVMFLGERQDARDLLPGLDLLVVPSIAREGFGLAAIEAMDAGVPVVASRVGGLPEIVEDGVSGLLVPPGAPADLAAAVTALLDRPEKARSFAAEGRRRVEERFRSEGMARRIESLYEEATHARRAA